ncbi:MAG: diguanylate cyclase [Polyangiaceae bacterium]
MPPSDDRPRTRLTPSQVEEVRGASVLVADDDRIAMHMLSNILRKAGHQVHEVGDGQEALERVAQGGIDLVLLDVVMPRLGGHEACRILKGMTSDGFLPVILVTVKTDTQSRVEGLKIGADDYVCKPFDEAELIARVNAMLRIKRLHDHVASQRARLEKLSIHDELTGLYNYRYLNTRLTEEFKRAERYHEPFACAVIDIDQLKAHNDGGGRVAGDAVIKSVADGIRRCVREVDVVARYGGEEFLVVLPSTHFAGSVAVAERIWREVRDRPIDVLRREPGDLPRREQAGEPTRGEGARWDGESRPLKASVSIGVALYPSRDVRSKDALLRAADAALSQAKREGGNRICVFQQQGYIYTPPVSGGSDTAPPRAESATGGRKPT